jgi:hypothetical protein
MAKPKEKVYEILEIAQEIGWANFMYNVELALYLDRNGASKEKDFALKDAALAIAALSDNWAACDAPTEEMRRGT